MYSSSVGGHCLQARGIQAQPGHCQDQGNATGTVSGPTPRLVLLNRGRNLCYMNSLVQAWHWLLQLCPDRLRMMGTQHDGGGTTPPPATSRSRSPVPTPGELFEEPPVPAQSLVVAKTCSIRERVSYGPTSEGKPEDCDVGSSRPPWTKRRRRALCFPWSLMHQILEKGGSASSRILASLSPSRFQREPGALAEVIPDQREAMSAAKSLEVDQSVATQAWEAVRHTVQLLRMRWVLTFESAGNEPDTRIVILGFSDPHLLEVETASWLRLPCHDL